MTRFSRWLSAVLAVCILANTIPISSFAQTIETEEPVLTADNGPLVVLEEEPMETTDPETEMTKPVDPETETAETAHPETEVVEPTGQETVAAEEEASSEEESVSLSEPENQTGVSFEEVLKQNGINGVLSETDGGVTLTVTKPEVLVLLSKQPASEYQNWKILFSGSGSFTLLEEAFAGLGSEEHPFAGTVSCDHAFTITCNQTLFNALNAAVKFENVNISWNGPSTQPILAKTLVADVSDVNSLPNLSGATSFSPYIGKVVKASEVQETGVITLPALTYTPNIDTVYKAYPGHTGLACGEMEAGTKLTITSLSVLEEQAFTLISDKTTADGIGKDAGSLVGHMGAGAQFTISMPLKLAATLDGENTGGLVGSMEEGAELTIFQPVTLTAKASGGSTNFGGLVGSINNGTIQLNANVTLTAGMAGTGSVTGAAGGIAGVVITQDGPLEGNNNIILESVTAYGASNAGVLYGDCTVTGIFSPLDNVTLPADATYTVKGTSCGGVFGTLTLENAGRCEMKGASDSKITLNTTFPNSTTTFGGVAGTLKGAQANALVIENLIVKSKFDFSEDPQRTSYPTFFGGLVATQGENVTLDVKSTAVTLENPKIAGTSGNASHHAVAGLTAYVSDGALLLANDVTVKSSFDSYNRGGGGVAGYTGKGSIVYLTESLDLSDCQLTTDASFGQLVGYQDCSLIYGLNLRLTRYRNGLQLDDIGNYGELYRVPDTENDPFLTLDTETYKTTFKTLDKTDDVYVLKSPQDYACLALAWQSRGYFDTVQDINNENWSTLKSSTIILGNTIDLKNKGIGGLSRDVASDDDTFSGTFDGGSNAIILDIGAANSTNGVTKGDGRIYWHNAPGLFAVLSSGATVENLTLGGSIRISNEATSPMYCGALAARLNCDAGKGTPLSTSVKTTANYDVQCSSTKILYVGGLIGNAYGSEATTLNLDSAQAAVITASTSGNSNHFGGVIGAIQAGTPLNINCGDGAELGGSITINNASDTLYAGALLGTAFPSSGGAKRTITLNNGVTVSDFSLSGSATKRMSGILGGIWANTDVVMNGLTVAGTTLESKSAAALGGLVYRASGKWTVNRVDLSGLEIKASNAAALGLLVCKGGYCNNEPINGSNQSIGGLYLELPKHWATAYTVPTDEKIQFEIESGVFDEFVAYTACQNSTGYQITYSDSGIVSLKTTGTAVNMDTTQVRNTYENRTDVGKKKTTNANSRYYYNLPEVLAACEDVTIDKPEELLIWSVCRYAASNLRDYFSYGEVKGSELAGVTTIGGNAVQSFDMKGLSYYPIRIVNSNITVQNADIKFYNKQIEQLETTPTDTSPINKSTRDNTQHYTMHCGLFLDFVADGSKESKYTMKVNGVSFDGTVGTVTGQSGALICGTVAGKQQGASTSVCKVVLGESDDETNAVTLNGIQVDSKDDYYKPVLIGKMGDYIVLKASYVTYGSNKYLSEAAGSSLIGNVGEQGAKSVSLEFAGTIKLPDTYASGVFTRATLLNQLQYSNGSASYYFTEEQDTAGKATIGKEIGNGDGRSVEYAGLESYYDVSPGSNEDPKPVRPGEDISQSYLPYVYLSPASGYATEDRHELRVNVRPAVRMDGCGTYGDPYLITEPDQLRAVAAYINGGTPIPNWQIRVPAEGSEYHTGSENDSDITLTYSGGWKDTSGNPNNRDVRLHLSKAYYQLKNNFELNNFIGLGRDGSIINELPFQGVIDGAGYAITLTGSKGSFINYSYGSVVRNLTINLNQELTITADTAPEMKTDNGTTTRSAQQAPSKFFGGVIGCVLGGDNIIDGVTISGGSKISASGDYAHLVPIGGFVGVIAGGGVIFRGTCSGDISANDPNLLYRNPIIGRVLGGFAFRKSDDAITDNGDRNYKINTLSEPYKSLEWDGTNKALTVNSAEGLLILSAIVSSGAGSPDSNAYKKGTARLASYEQIGVDGGAADLAKDTGVPYLLSTTGIGKVEICGSGTDGINLNFKAPTEKDKTFSMSSYGNGYRGLSARYVSNAGFDNKALTPNTVVMRVKRLNGNGRIVSGIKMDVKEYADDDFHAASMGGIFNIVWTMQNDGGRPANKDTGDPGSVFAQDLTLESCTVSLTYRGWDEDGNPEDKVQADTSTFKDKDGLSCVAVGGFVGSISDVISAVSMSSHKSNYLFKEIHIRGSEGSPSIVTGPNSAGGLIGATAMTGGGLSGSPGKLLSNQTAAQFGPSFLNCSYSYTNVTAKLAAGGMVGAVYALDNNTAVPQFINFGFTQNNNNKGCYATCSITRNDLTYGSNSVIKTTAIGGLCSGMFGTVGMRTRVNDPDIDSKTGLTILNGIEASMLTMSNVQMLAETTDGTLKIDDDKTANNANSNGTTGAAGCIGKIGYSNPVYFYKVTLDGCKLRIADTGAGYAGGIVGSGYTNTTLSVYDSVVKNTEITAQYAGGLLGVVEASTGSALNAINCDIDNCTISGRTAAGGIVGKAQYNFRFFNIRLKDTSVIRITTSKDTDTQSNKTAQTGRLVGQPANLMLTAAGISVVKTPGSNANIPDWDVGSGTDGKATTAYGTGGYVAYADYSGLEKPASNPQFSLKTGESTEKLLYGDAVGKIDGDGSVAARILKDHKAGASSKKNLAPYPSGANTPYSQNASAIAKSEATSGWRPEVSTFKAEQKYTDEQWPSDYGDLPVLLLKGKDSGKEDIVRYLNLITNGAYSNSSVPKTVNVTAYSYNKETKQFTEGAGREPASVVGNGGDFLVYKSRYDNTRDRFSLVEVTFTVNAKEASVTDRPPCTYTISVPVMVIRELQYIYSTTFSYGTEFYPAAYDNLTSHVLDSTDTPFSAYLTLQYNRDKSQYSEYGWEDLISEGSKDFLNIEKVLRFKNNGDAPMPAGTRLTLLDCQHGNKMYFCQIDDGRTEISLGEFKDSSGKNFQSSMADVLGVTCAPNNTSGKFVTTTNVEDATVFLGGAYYRPWTTSDSESNRFDLTIPDFSKMDVEDLPKENYLLVIEIPNQSDHFALNGQLHIALNDVIASEGTAVHRNPKVSSEPGDNDEFSYLIFSGYRQSLKSLNSVETKNLPQKPSSPEDPIMRFHLQDTITFSGQQAYNAGDHLYLKFTATPQISENGNTGPGQFPAGTSGTVHFYIHNADGSQYFIPDDQGVLKAVNSETEAVSYRWISGGDNMELPLSSKGTMDTLLDLASVRTAVKNSTAEDSSFVVTAYMEVDFSKLSEKAFEETIPASENLGADRYVRLHYQAQLSTQKESLNYSSAKVVKDDNAKYYRSVKYEAVLSMDAATIDQLGINPLQLVEDYQETIVGRNASRIDLTAALNLANLQNIESVLQSTESVTFTLSLQRKDDDYTKNVNDADKYIAFKWPDEELQTWTWSIPQEKYYKDGKIVTNDIFDGTQFTFPITAYVFTDQKDFANYKMKLTVSFGENSSVSVTDTDANVIYTYACIKPSFYELQ